ncbi:hypothetical protein FHK92_01990 [Pseudomonas brassicacearum subsp. neoaurantiaca]|uniref:Uncharacterized protein n=1 Tax=Pseudomonas brassicacearum subsp. neoaurantiaca TaxID=494916 RepID=A0A7V8RHK6_9PSED|nr:hypothetical protein [Pseudomonas brassicacearum subsp. neoaurantiaca]
MATTRSGTPYGSDHFSWRGSLLPLGCAAAAQLLRVEKAGAASPPSGSKLPRHKGHRRKPLHTDVHNFPSPHANHRLSFKQVRSICVNGSVDYGRFVANRFE